MFNSLQNYFFDLDGTIINSEPGLLSAHTHCLEQLRYMDGLRILAEEGIGWTIGPPLGLSVPRLIGSEEPSAIQNYIATFQQAYQNIYYKDFILYDGIEELLQKLKLRNKTLFVCTSKPQPIARKIMQYLNYDSLLTDLIGAHMDESPHEKSDLLQELCHKYDCVPEQSAMIGDRCYDMSAGRELGFTVRIGVTYGFGSEQELRASGATHIVSRPQDILESPAAQK